MGKVYLSARGSRAGTNGFTFGVNPGSYRKHSTPHEHRRSHEEWGTIVLVVVINNRDPLQPTAEHLEVLKAKVKMTAQRLRTPGVWRAGRV